MVIPHSQFLSPAKIRTILARVFNHWLYNVGWSAEAYSSGLRQTSKRDRFAEIVNGFYPLTIFAKYFKKLKN